MFPGMTAVPPPPPEIAQQQMASAAPMFTQMGAQMGAMRPQMADPVSVLEGQIAQLEEWAGRTSMLLNQVNPGLSALLVPIAAAGKALQTEVASMRQQLAGPSPVVGGSVPPVVPGNIPGGQAA